jgi:hypothetical protein
MRIWSKVGAGVAGLKTFMTSWFIGHFSFVRDISRGGCSNSSEWQCGRLPSRSTGA